MVQLLPIQAEIIEQLNEEVLLISVSYRYNDENRYACIKQLIDDLIVLDHNM